MLIINDVSHKLTGVRKKFNKDLCMFIILNKTCHILDHKEVGSQLGFLSIRT